MEKFCTSYLLFSVLFIIEKNSLALTKAKLVLISSAIQLKLSWLPWVSMPHHGEFDSISAISFQPHQGSENSLAEGVYYWAAWFTSDCYPSLPSFYPKAEKPKWRQLINADVTRRRKMHDILNWGRSCCSWCTLYLYTNTSLPVGCILFVSLFFLHVIADIVKWETFGVEWQKQSLQVRVRQRLGSYVMVTLWHIENRMDSF